MSHRFPRETGPPKPSYVAVVVALAIFFVGLALGTPTGSNFVLTADVVLPACSASSRANLAIADDQIIADAARVASRQVADSAGDAGSRKHLPARLDHKQLEALRRQLRVAAGQATQGEWIRLHFTGDDLSWSKTFLTHLASELAAGAERESDAETSLGDSMRLARWNVFQSQHYERKALFDMESTYAAREFEGRDPSFSEHTARTATDCETNLAPSPSSSRSDPPREDLQTRLLELQQQRDEMLRTVTSSHPLVRNVALEIETVEHQLAETEAAVDDTGVARSAVGPAASAPWPSQQAGFAAIGEPDSSETPASLDSEESQGTPPTIGRLEALAGQRREAERRLAQLMVQQQTAGKRALHAGVGIVRPAELERRISTRPSPWLVLSVGLVALQCGWLVFGWASRVGRASPLATEGGTGQWHWWADHAMAGEPLAMLDERHIPSQSSKRWLRRCILASELVLAAMVVLFLWSVFKDSSAVTELADNPLGTFIRRVAAPLGG